MDGWRRSRLKGGRSANYRKSSTVGSFDYDEEEDEVDWDPTKSKDSHNLKNVNDALRASLAHVVTKPSYPGQKDGVNDSRSPNKNKRITHLNGLIRLWNIKRELEKNENRNKSGDTTCKSTENIENQGQHIESLRLRELLLCLRVPLVHESSDVRASTLRTIRLLLTETEHVHLIYQINLHHLVIRSLDIDLDNKIERIQALKLIRRCTQIGSLVLPLSLVRAIVALVEGGPSEGDRLYRASLCICCELSLLNSDLFIKGNGVPAFTHAILDCSVSRMAEAVLGCLVALHNDPATRHRAKVQLGIVVAPFTEFRYVHSAHAPGAVMGPGPGPGPGGGHEIGTDPAEERDFRFQCAETVVLSMMRSWPGLLQMTEPGAKNGVSHLQALVDILYLENSYVRKKLLLLLYELLNLKAPNDFSNFSSALEAANPTSFRESWKLAEDFVAREGLDILPQLAKSRPNLLEAHIGYVLCSLLKTELPDALIKVIVSADSDELSILATILLGEILHLAYILLPRELNATSHCLPALLAEVSCTDAIRSNRAAEAVDALHRLHDLKKRGPVGNSLFLVQIMSESNRSVGKESFIGDRLHSPANWSELLRHEPAANERLNASIRDSQVNNVTVDPDTYWDWDLIMSVFKWPSDAFKSLDTPENRNFVKRVVEFFKPSGNQFSTVELRSSSGKYNKKSRYLAKTCCCLLDFLTSEQSAELSRILDDFLSDIQTCFKALNDAASTHDCFLSPTRIATTTCQYYFLFIGRLSRSEIGRKALDKYNFLQTLTLMLSFRSDLYLKLVISCLDYSTADWGSRNLLAKALTKEGSESCRLYATRFLGVLIRSRTANVAQWGLELLVSQLFDNSKTVAWVALDLLEDACDDKMNLEAVVCTIKTRPLSELDHLGLKGILLYSRFLSSNSGFNFLSQKNEGAFLEQELNRWALGLNLKYVSLMEELLNDGLSRHQLNETRTYGRRSREGFSLKDVFVPPHLYGQLALTKAGLDILFKHQALIDMLKVLVNLSPNPMPSNGTPLDTHDFYGSISMTKKEWIHVKSAIWGIAHVSSSSSGAKWVDQHGGIAAIITIAERCDVYSLRGTAFYALGLIATNKVGCQILSSYGWCSLRYGRNEQLSIVDDWFQNTSLQNRDSADRFGVEVSADEGSDAACSSVTSSLTDPERISRLSASEPHKYSWNLLKQNKDSHLQPVTPKGQNGRSESFTISSRKKISSIFRSLSLGKDDSKRKEMEAEETNEGKNKDYKEKKSFTLPRKIRRTLFATTKSSTRGNIAHSINEGNSSVDNVQNLYSDLPDDKDKRSIKPELDRSAPFATPENSNDSCSEKDETAHLGDIKEETTPFVTAESFSEEINIAQASNASQTIHIYDVSSCKDQSKPIVEAAVSNEESKDTQKSVLGHTDDAITIQHSPVSLLPININVSSGRKTLSPIASTTSINDMEMSCGDENSSEQTTHAAACESKKKFKIDMLEANTLEKLDAEDDDIGQLNTTATDKLEITKSTPSAKVLADATEPAISRSLPPVPFKRTGQRAFSESEAHNFSHLASNTAIIPHSSGYWTSSRSTRSEDSYSETRRNVTLPGVPKISLISGSQHGTMCPIETPCSKLCTSVTSVSSGGSWTENPGFLTVRSLRKRPQIVDNETFTNIDGITKPAPTGCGIVTYGQDYNRHSQRATPVGMFGSGEGMGGNTTISSNARVGIPRRRDSSSQKFSSFDYRFNKLTHHLHSVGQGNSLRNDMISFTLL